LSTPAGATEPKPGVLVIHENGGLNPYIEDVVRRFAAADLVALRPDAPTRLGGYPGNDDKGREMQRQLDREVMMQDWMAAFRFLGLRTKRPRRGYGSSRSTDHPRPSRRCRRSRRHS